MELPQNISNATRNNNDVMLLFTYRTIVHNATVLDISLNSGYYPAKYSGLVTAEHNTSATPNSTSTSGWYVATLVLYRSLQLEEDASHCLVSCETLR